MDLGHDVDAVDDERRVARHPQRHVEDRSALRDVDLLAAEHHRDPLGEARLLGERHEEPERLVGHSVLRVVEVEARPLGREACAARRSPRRTGRAGADPRSRRGATPARPTRDAAQGRDRRVGRRRHRRVSSSGGERGRLGVDVGHEVVPGVDEALAALDWRVAARAVVSIPAASYAAIVAALSPPSAGMGLPACPWSKKARSVASGTVLTVNGRAELVHVERRRAPSGPSCSCSPTGAAASGRPGSPGAASGRSP